MSEIEELKAELQKFKDMAKKGLDEFKDVGGCWGCGLQLQLNQDMEDIKRLKAENERLKRENEIITGMHNSLRIRFDKLYNTLQEIKEYLEDVDYIAQFNGTPYDLSIEIKQFIRRKSSEK